MFKYNFNKDKNLKYQLKRCLGPESYDTLEDAKFKALINSIGFIDAKDISILVGYWTMHNCIECAFNYSTVSISFKIFNNGFDLNFGDFLVKDKDSILYHNNGIEASQYLYHQQSILFVIFLLPQLINQILMKLKSYGSKIKSYGSKNELILS